MSIFSQDVIVDNTVTVDGSAVTQPISAASLPLPAGAATESTVAGLLTDTELRAAPVPVSGPLTDTQLRAAPVPVSGSVSTTPVVSSSSTVSQVTSTGVNQTVLAANVSRKKAILFFESGIWSVKLGAVASSSSRTYVVNSSNTTIEITVWTGQIDVLCTTSNKLVNVTELV